MKPRVSVNLAISADGRISDVRRRPSGWTSGRDHQRLLDLRRGADALMVGRATWIADQMTMRIPGDSPQPLRCIISRHGDLPASHPIFQSPGGDIHVLCTEGMPDKPMPPGTEIHMGSLESFLHALAENHDVRRIHCEGGGYLVSELLRIHAVDELHLTIAAHTIFGGQSAPTATGIPDKFQLPESTFLLLDSFEPDESLGECYLTYRRP